MLHHMYSVGLDVDKLVFTVKILLYAGNSFLNSPLAFIALGIIYLLQSHLPGQSAGNHGFSTKASAITKNTYNKYTDLPSISEHVPSRKTNVTDVEFGYFLAGLIEGSGWFGKKQLYIVFSQNDTSLAYYIKKRIGYGNVYKTIDKKVVRYLCKHEKGLSIILSLINGKLVSKYKHEQLIKHNYTQDFDMVILPPMYYLSLDNHWLAGFTQVQGCFHICVIKSKTHKTGLNVKLEYSLKQNDDLPLKLLHDKLKKGNLSQHSTGIWCYKSSDYKTAVNLINYFDKFNLFAGKYTSYLKFRKVYIMITEKKHLEEKGVKKIMRISSNMSLLSSFSSSVHLLCAFYLADVYFNNSILLSSNISFALAFSPLLGIVGAGVPIKTYANAETQKLQIIKQNKQMAGVYLWENKIKGKRYVGSSLNLSKRFMHYFNYNHLTRYANMNICRALLKYRYSNYDLTILEYCEPSKCLEREQYYINLLKSEYNILQTAGSSLGYKHTEQALTKIVDVKKGKKHSSEWIAKFVASNLGRKSPMNGKKYSEKRAKECPKLN